MGVSSYTCNHYVSVAEKDASSCFVLFPSLRIFFFLIKKMNIRMYGSECWSKQQAYYLIADEWLLLCHMVVIICFLTYIMKLRIWIPLLVGWLCRFVFQPQTGTSRAEWGTRKVKYIWLLHIQLQRLHWLVTLLIRGSSCSRLLFSMIPCWSIPPEVLYTM